MAMPRDIGIVDLMIGFPSANARRHYDFMQAQLRDAESRDMEFPVEYMFKQVPNELDEGKDPVEVTLGEMDRYGIAIGLVGIGGKRTEQAVKEHPDRFVTSLEVDPNDITGAVRNIRRAH
ncbi:MAG: amidohydrolase, partial [Actinobacteria bacterium]|nr:amidohydrolase [Actinomycetota bacterium]